MRNELPSYRQAISSISKTGDMLKGSHVGWDTGVAYKHPEEEKVNIVVDDRILPAIGTIYTNNQALAHALAKKKFYPIANIRAVQLLNFVLSGSDVVWGFAGYASVFPGANYHDEAKGIEILHKHLRRTKQKPALVVDGGVRIGTLGLSGVIASQFQVPNLGFIPLKGLGSMGPRTHMVVCGITYPDRERAVASASDILVCWGGKEGTTRECIAAIENGSIVIIMQLDKYKADSLPGQYSSIPRLKKAENDGQLIVCRSLDAITRCVDLALVAHHHTKKWSRPQRLNVLRPLLHKG